jgi:urea transport system substrate-binding protein
MSVQSPANTEFKTLWANYIKNPRRVTNDPMEATLIGFRMWAQAVAQAGTTGGRRGAHGDDRPEGRGTLRLRRGDAPQPPPVQAGDDRRGAGGRASSTSSGRRRAAIVAENWSPFIPENANRRRG